MNTEQFNTLQFYKAWLFSFIGASVTLLALALVNIPYQTIHGILSSDNWTWYLIWLTVQAAGVPLALILVATRGWRGLVLRERLNSVYAYLATEWVLFFALGLKYSGDENDLLNGLAGYLLLLMFVLATLALVLSYWRLRRSHTYAPEELFP